jgi:hypothetical protein
VVRELSRISSDQKVKNVPGRVLPEKREARMENAELRMEN